MATFALRHNAARQLFRRPLRTLAHSQLNNYGGSASFPRMLFSSIAATSIPPLPSPEDASIDRRGTGSRKWTQFGDDKVPLWVADMDFRTAVPIIDAVKEVAEHGIYGYAGPPAGMKTKTAERLCNRYGFHSMVEQLAQVEKSIRYIPGLLPVR